MTKIGLLDVKKALKDARFREALPESFKKTREKELVKFLSDSGCACNVPLYRAVLRECSNQLQEYYPGKEIIKEEEEIKKLSGNNWTVINCHIDELEEKLKRLPKGRKQVAITRYEDQLTVIINELDVLW